MAPGGDSALPQILKKRLVRSEGAENAHCYTREAAQSSTADARSSPEEKPIVEPGKLFSMDANDTPPASRSPSPSPMAARKLSSASRGSSASDDCRAKLKGGEDEAETTDGLPDHQDGGDGELQGYDWQFEIMNSMPRDKALELARVLKRSEQENARESAKLRQEVSGLKKQVTRSSAKTSNSYCLMSLAIFVAVVAVAVGAALAGVPLSAQAPVASLLAAVRPAAHETGAEHASQVPPAVPATQVPPAVPATQVPPAVPATQVPPAAPATQETPAAPATQVPPAAPATQETPSAPVTQETAAEPAKQAKQAAPTVPTTDTPTEAAAAKRAPQTTQEQKSSAVPRPQVPLWSAHVLPKSGRIDLWHPALSQDVAAFGPMKADLGPAMQYFPKVSQQGWRFASVWVTRSALNNRQVALASSFSIGNNGAITWPASTTMRLILGPGMGFTGLTVGHAVMPGSNMELNIQLEVPKQGHGDGAGFSRSVWVLEANGEPFGPLLIAEFNWVA
eukprot:TRINITY_DN3366_c0_g1_i1.p1 TRINITY_DN3366_c0_g1~~TRINITY_DN3366_c0_g1_i1.p1  ORF type:complete len:523 (+),score=117.06 TRINITY_DN3366_c0_g1_i1:50-1570(+)